MPLIYPSNVVIPKLVSDRCWKFDPCPVVQIPSAIRGVNFLFLFSIPLEVVVYLQLFAFWLSCVFRQLRLFELEFWWIVMARVAFSVVWWHLTTLIGSSCQLHCSWLTKSQEHRLFVYCGIFLYIKHVLFRMIWLPGILELSQVFVECLHGFNGTPNFFEIILCNISVVTLVTNASSSNFAHKQTIFVFARSFQAVFLTHWKFDEKLLFS